MKIYKVAPMMVEKYNVIIVWLGKMYIGKEKEIQQSIDYFDKLFSQEIIIFMVDDLEQVFYHGKKEIIDKLDKNAWRRFPWQQVTIKEKES